MKSAPTVGKHGANQHSERGGNGDNVLKQRGTSLTYQAGRLKRDRPDLADAIKAIDRALQRPAGGNNNPHGNNQHEKKEVNVDIVNVDSAERPTGTSRAAGLRRLRKDRPDLYDAGGQT